MGLFDGGIKKIVGQALGRVFLPGVIHTDPVQTKVRGVPSGPKTWKNTPIKGLREDYDQAYAMRTGIPDTDVKILVLQHKVKVTPNVADEVSLKGVRYSIIAVGSDPADATWALQSRPV